MKKVVSLLPLLVPFNTISIFGLRPLDLFYGILCFLLFFSKDLHRKKYTTSVFASVFLFFILTLFSTLLVENYNFNVSQFKYMEVLVFVVILSLIDFNYNDLKVIKRNLYIAAALICFGSILRLIITPSMHRYAGFFIYSDGIEMSDIVLGFNEIGAFLAIVSALIIQDLIKRFNTNVSLFLLVIIFCLLLTKSRSALLALALSSFFIFIISDRSHTKKIILSLFLISSIFYLEQIGLISFSRLTSSFEIGTFDNYTMMQRFVFWEKGFNALQDNILNFLFGYGGGGIAEAVGGSTTDNFYLDLFLRYGLLGFILILFLYAVPLFLSNGYRHMIPLYIIISFVSLSGNVLSDIAFGGSVFLILYGYVNNEQCKDTYS